jgi:dTDP-glucose 4,6-dehydratase
MSTKKLLVTGGAGFIGANFVHYWRRRRPHDTIIVLDALTYAGNVGSLEPLLSHSLLTFVHGDLADFELVAGLMRQHEINVVIHFAAETHVDRSLTGPDAFVETNLVGTHNLLKAARLTWLEEKLVDSFFRFHHVSTDEVYGSLGPDDPPFHEQSPYAPNSPYAASKAGSDHLVRAYHRSYGLPVVMTNSSNNYGPYQYPEKLVPLMLINALEGRPLPVYGDGLNVRDWLYVEDHCRGIEAALTNGTVGTCYNIGSNTEMRNIDVVKMICKAVDEAFVRDSSLRERFPNSPSANGASARDLIFFVKDRPGHDRRYAIDASRIFRELGFQPKETFQSGLRKTIRWHLDNEPWWRSVMDGGYRNWIDEQYRARAFP